MMALLITFLFFKSKLGHLNLKLLYLISVYLNVHVTCEKITVGLDNQFKIQLHFWQFKLNWV